MDNTITSITTGPRQSNFELLRIIAMFLVLIVHADFFSIGVPVRADLHSDPLNFFGRVFFESCSIVCVNTFIMISGWFGIRASLKGLSGFMFQCLYFLAGVYLIMILLGRAEFNLSGGVTYCLFVRPGNWFVCSYIGLYLLSPIINSYLENASKRQIGTFLIVFYVFQSIWGWTGGAQFIEFGYSTFSFIGLYILAHFIRKYGLQYQRFGIFIYLISVIVLVIAALIVPSDKILLHIYDYVNPVVVVASAGMVLWISGLHIKTKKIINWIAKSTFAVYLFHLNPYIVDNYFKKYCRLIYDEYTGIEYMVIIFVYLLLIYFISVLIDQPRKIIWAMVVRNFKK